MEIFSGKWPNKSLEGARVARSFAPRFLPTLGHPHAVALRFVRCDQLTGGLSPPRVRPCRAHAKKNTPYLGCFLLEKTLD